MPGEIVCWKCGASLAALSLPFGRFDECRQCHAPLHACRLCEFHEPTVAKQCREPIAEEVRDKERVNYCDYFKPRAGAYVAGKDAEQERARAALESLFGGGKT